jgi:PIN domain nuclease of toxin-antitoxin system
LKLLLDTPIWLWLFREQKRLGRRTLQILKDQKNELWLSPISTWEIITLHQKGRIKFNLAIAEWVAKATAGTKEAPFTHEIAMAGIELPLNLDPADRIIAGTARVLELTLITADHRLLELTTINTLANR